MRIKLWHQLTLSTLVMLSCATGALAEATIFSKYSFDQAKEQAQKDSKLLLIDFTATWCPPCQKMESTTWIDATVQKWVKENAIAIQIDVDKDEKTTAALQVEAMPTLVLFTPQKGSKEFGRQVGYMSASELLRWLNGAKSGKSATEVEKQKAEVDDGAIWTRISKSRELQNTGKNEEALTEYIWLWGNIRSDDTNLADIRCSLLPFEIKKLCKDYPAAKVKFAEIRDAAEKDNNRADWLLLNGMLDDSARTVAWFDKIKVDPTQHDEIKKHSKVLETVLFSKNRWTDAVTFMYPDPMAKLNEIYKSAEDMKKPRPDTEVSKDFDPLPSMVLLLYGSYIGAGKEAEAKKIEDECLRLDNSEAMRTGLTNMATGMRIARQTQTQTQAQTKTKTHTQAQAQSQTRTQTQTQTKAVVKSPKRLR